MKRNSHFSDAMQYVVYTLDPKNAMQPARIDLPDDPWERNAAVIVSFQDLRNGTHPGA